MYVYGIAIQLAVNALCRQVYRLKVFDLNIRLWCVIQKDEGMDVLMQVEVRSYLMGPYNAGPKSALFFRVAVIKAGVREAGVIRSILKREYHVCERLSSIRRAYGIATLASHEVRCVSASVNM